MRGFGEGPVADCLWIGDIFSDEGGPTENSLAGGFLTVKIKSFRFGFEGGIEFIVDCAVFDIEETPGRVGQRSWELSFSESCCFEVVGSEGLEAGVAQFGRPVAEMNGRRGVGCEGSVEGVHFQGEDNYNETIRKIAYLVQKCSFFDYPSFFLPTLALPARRFFLPLPQYWGQL
jgi:hypothetical protein